jgi:hypothetical protein
LFGEQAIDRDDDRLLAGAQHLLAKGWALHRPIMAADALPWTCESPSDRRVDLELIRK